MRSNPTDTSALLADLNFGVAAQISYQSRETEGTQTPVETLNRGWGSCRDLAVLFIEAARSLGFGARVVTGYLYRAAADAGSPAAIGAGTTHAWADIYVPGSGWIAYDPTNGTIGGMDLIRVAVTRDISQAVPDQRQLCRPAGQLSRHDRRRCRGVAMPERETTALRLIQKNPFKFLSSRRRRRLSSSATINGSLSAMHRRSSVAASLSLS